MSEGPLWRVVRIGTGVLLIGIGVLKFVPSETLRYVSPQPWLRVVTAAAAILEIGVGLALVSRRTVHAASMLLVVGAGVLGLVVLLAGPQAELAGGCGCLGPIRVSHFQRVMLTAALAFLGALNLAAPSASGTVRGDSTR